jgi:hypothetical protein
MAAVAQAGALLDQCRPCHLQVFEHKQGVRSGRIRFQPQGSPHPGQDACIDGIGLGSGSARFGKATGLQRIDLDQRQLARQRRLEGPVIGPCRFEDDAGDRRLAEPADQGPEAPGRVLEPPRRLVFQSEDVEMGFRDVDANGMFSQLRQVLCLSCVTQTRVSVQAPGEDGG